MKKYILSIALTACTVFCSAQNFAGLWEGTLNAGAEVRLIFRITQESGTMQVMLDCPDQGLKDVKTANVLIKGDTLSFEITQFQASYSGTLRNDSLLTGIFRQGVSFPLTLKKVMQVAKKVRPQTPVPPYPYESKDVLYTNPDKTITYGATLTIPSGKGPFPALLLLTGSGQQNRDEEILGHKPFAVLADHLTRNGFIVLRVDDRGIGQTTGDARMASTLDFAKDATVSLDFLLQQHPVDRKRVGLIGHSEGGMIAQLMAAERKDLRYVVLLAGPGEKTLKLMRDQNEAILLRAGLPKDYVSSYLVLYNTILTTILRSEPAVASAHVKTVVNEWMASTSPAVVEATTRITDEASKDNFVNAFVSQVGGPWYRYFLAYDPASNLSRITADVLALNGSQDLQVVSKTNLAGIEAALQKGKSKRYAVKELEGLNHLFQECRTCTLAEYGQLAQTISPQVLELITRWLQE